MPFVSPVRLTGFGGPIESSAMEGILVFDQTNDLIYHNFNEAMREKMHKQALDLGLLEEETVVSRQRNTLRDGLRR